MGSPLSAAELQAFLGLAGGANESFGFLGMPRDANTTTTSAITSWAVYDSLCISGGSLVLLLAAELASLSSVRGVLRQHGGRELYATAVIYNLVNFFIIGPITYAFATTFLCTSERKTLLSSVSTGIGLLLVHALGYYLAHFAMHTKSLYWAHRFHHRFNTHIVPMAANAVTFSEYVIAYMLPFIVGCLLFNPDVPALFGTASVISFNNILIHTPGLDELSRRIVPWWGVSTYDHTEHHRRLTTNYAAPTINIDKILAAIVGSRSEKAGKFS
ncbi:hypothetical protein AB1Y20_003158 [Prymnesium parvum]